MTMISYTMHTQHLSKLLKLDSRQTFRHNVCCHITCGTVDHINFFSGDSFSNKVMADINVLCPPPTLLRMMGARASSQLTDLKLLYVGGEELPKDVADVWSRGRQLENG